MQLPFEHVPWNKEDRLVYDNKIKDIKKEEKMTGERIKKLLIEKIKLTNFIHTTERNVRGINENPFDMIIGDEQSLELMGLEIKGDTDNFSRLKDQLRAYEFTFEEVYLVVHKHKAPDWLPKHIGILRILQDGEVFIESSSYSTNPFNISSQYEWDTLFRENGLGTTSKHTEKVLNCILDIRKNIIFNRFFGVHDGVSTKRMTKLYPFTEEQKSIIIGFDIPYHYKQAKKEVEKIEKKIILIKELCSLGQKGIGDFNKITSS